MRYFYYLAALVALMLVASSPAKADDLSSLIYSVTAQKSEAKMSLASVSVGENQAGYTGNARQYWWFNLLSAGSEEKSPAGAAVPGSIRLAGACGSSGYSCTAPGFLYCCGNSTDGFYCAADVNGC